MRALARALTFASALAATLALCTHGARAAGKRLCDGYAACTAAGYPSHGYGAHAGSSYWMMSAGDECTNYAAYVEQTEYGVQPPGYVLGDGGVWAQSARAHGVAVDRTPTVGAVAEWDDGTAGIGGPGHVGVVEAVGRVGNRIAWIDVSQQHIDGDVDGYDWERIDARGSPQRWEPWPSNFIHFAGAPTRARLLSMYGGSLYRIGGLPVRAGA
ncbi:MAG TPA: CHAP domain-containing protein [Solirubrobacteraceae bacterium]|nr:CHAP domain-containing protein [Solirubrobacteraceae bacterium]